MRLTCYTLDGQPGEIVPGSPDRDWMDSFDSRHPYRCLPLVMANSTGWELLCPCSFTATWTGGPAAEDIRLDLDDDFPDIRRVVTSHFTRGTLTFHTGYLFRTEPGWDMWVGGPPNVVKDGIVPLTGIVETDWLPFAFTMNYHFTRPGMVSFKKGEPFCFIMPVPHASVDQFDPVIKNIHDDPELHAEYMAWYNSRAGFLASLEANDPDALREGWQRHYFKGKTATGAEMTDDHINRRRLKTPRKE